MDKNLDAIAELIGHNAAIKLARACQHPARKRNVLYVPVREKNGMNIARIIGDEQFKKLHSVFAGCQLTLGDPERFSRLEQARRGLRSDRLPVAQLSARYGVSRHFLYNQLARR